MFVVGKKYDLEFVCYGEEGPGVEMEPNWVCIEANGLIGKFQRFGTTRIINPTAATFVGAIEKD